MTRYEGRAVVATGTGQCPLCCRDVHRVLVETSKHTRSWHTADLGHGGYGPHVCPGGYPPPAPQPPTRPKPPPPPRTPPPMYPEAA